MKTTTQFDVDAKKHPWRALWSLMRITRPPWFLYLIYLILCMIQNEVLVLIPKLTGEIMNGNALSNPGMLGRYFLYSIAGLPIFLAVNIFNSWCGIGITRKVQHVAWGKFLRLPMVTLDEHNPTSLVSRINSDASQLSVGIMYFFQIYTYGHYTYLMLQNIYAINSKLVIPFAMSIPFTLVITVICGRLQYKVKNRNQSALSRFTNYVAEGLNNLRLVKACSAEKQEAARGTKAAMDMYDAKIYSAKIGLITTPLQQLSGAICQVIILIYSAVLIANGEMQTGDIVTIFMYLGSLTGMVSMLSQIWGFIKQTQGATVNITELVSVKSEEMERERSFNVPDEDIRFQNVTFAYGDTEVLHNVSCTFPQGKTTAIVGPSGSGKTTMLSLIERFYQPQSGQICFGNVNAETFHLNEWRRAFGYVPQMSPLLSGTIRENVNYGLDKPASDEELVRAAKIANIYDFIQTLPEGFDSNVGQIGGKLSGGERQRIAIARTAIKNPDYLLLDEATSSLDPQNATEVQVALGNLMRGRTSIVVAHNLRTVVTADHIVVVNKGCVEAEGTHKELYASNELYRRYCDLQLAV